MTRSSPGSTTAGANVTNLDALFSKMEVIDVEAVASGVTELWYNEALCECNSSVVRLGVIQGEYHWHRHDDGDEMFIVLTGELFLDLAERNVTLKHGQGFVVPKGTIHRTRANRRTVILMIEEVGTVPAGD